MGRGVRLHLGVLGCALVAALAPGWAGAAAPARPAEPVPSLTPAATQRLWEQLVRRPPLRSFGLAQCRPLRGVFYAGTDWLRLATRLAATPSPCAEYLISIPPLAADKTRFRTDQPWRIRALGPAFHAVAEINVTGWSAWVSSTGTSWHDAGVEARRRMAASGFDIPSGDTWALNELTSAVRQGTGAARANMRAFLAGLYEGEGVPVRGVVFTTGISQGTTDLSIYQARIQDWYEDSAFWTDLARTTSDWAQELYGDVRNYAVPGAAPATRGASLNEYLQHELALAAVEPGTAAAARSFIAATYSPLANAAWQYDTAFGWTNVPFDTMQDYVSAQTYALRAAGNSRFGFAWAPKNLAALPAADFNAQTDQILARLAAAIRDSAGAPEAACAGGWCTRTVDGAAFTTRWRSFAAWSPSAIAFTSPPPTLVAGAASPALTIELRTSTGVPYATGLPVPVALSSTSTTGGFATTPAGPFTPTLTVPIASAASTTSVYFSDTQPGTPTISATTSGKTGSTLTATVSPPAGGTPPETTLAAPPPELLDSRTVSIAFASGSPGVVRFECSFDGTPFATCASPATTTGLEDGPHVFDVRAVDAAGNVDPTPAHADWTVDATPPPTTIVKAPPARTRSTTARFTYLTEVGAGLQCSLDGGAYAPCRGAYSVRAGAHTLRARAVDPAGNADPTPARHAWTVDRTPPQTTIVVGPKPKTTSHTATFYFRASEKSTFRCSLDGRAFAPCKSPLRRTNLARGSHTLRIRATDAVGNVDATPAVRAWRIV